MKRTVGQSIWIRALGVVALLFAITGAAQAETTVERGDVLFVSVVGLPEVERNARVDADGRISLPFIGTVDVAGTQLGDIRESIKQTLISNKILLNPSVLVEVAVYRPIYVGGAVARSGAVSFEPGLTVRHALISAGGRIRSAESGAVNPGRVIELVSRRRATIYSLDQVDSEIARLQALLAEDPAEKPPEADLTPVDRALLDDLERTRDAEVAHAETALDLVETEREVLRQQAELQLSEQDVQQAEVERMRDLVARGLVPAPQLSDLQRESSRLSRDILDNHAYSARAAQTTADILYRTESSLAAARVADREAYRSALGRREALRAELEILTGHLSEVRSSTDTSEVPEGQIVIYRRTGDTTEELSASPDTELAPGDIVELRSFVLPRG
ncbi:polysaccharide export outer membrane protein [Jannaschia faecimaris]|uniref:Polysaccharide export outer membrane protein n=1 Tax=Jannaschia faecimaris TaxID=1244108 RepID=A0A1H3JB75_9RHOB|nr:polysaccharide biosynthesis/export family protein [Jannaschia faecimaris]SDY37162.1 polysaccharide export outer membrane protein [Jannaschia faecimaris]